ncbi:MAG: cystathionine gamma-synthase [Azospira oryzae]|jgi:cystathionine gamma-synthase|nr:MAG: cystathionine gamma-synthase [Azospira oryzae]
MKTNNEFLVNSHPQTQAIHAGYEPDLDISQPIHLTTTFKRPVHEQAGGYTRTGNPNRTTLENKLALLEGGHEAMAFGSGMAAINALFEVILQNGDHMIYPDDCYHGTRALMKNFFSAKNIQVTEVDMTSVDHLSAAITSKTKLIWLESPSNPKLKITDIEAVAALAKSKKIITACDSTFATPLLQKPLQLGIDFVMHSSTKFFSGHSDVLGGVVITREAGELSTRLRLYQGVAGAVPSPFDCWLLNRSIATFPLRVAAQNANALEVAGFLHKHPKIETVYYPGLATHTNHEVAKKQMKGGFGSIMSVLVKGGQSEAMKLVSRLQIINHATSLGGVETLIEHRRTAEGVMAISPDNLLRISIGIEYADDLIRDFKQALS